MNATWRYVLPNAVTCVGLTAGLLSISETITGSYRSAAWFVMLSVLLDKVDGAVARKVKGTSRFGMEMDSLSDLITFGVAPSVLVLGVMTGGGEAALVREPLLRGFTYFSCFFYVIAAALRLAKFNVVSERYGKEFFFGIPTTSCGALLSLSYLTAVENHLPSVALQGLPLLLLVLAFGMVSRLPLPKLGKRTRPWLNVFQWGNVALIYACGLLRVLPEYILACGLLYLLVGMGWSLLKGIRPPSLDA